MEQTQKAPEAFTFDELAERFGLNPSTVRALVIAHNLQTVNAAPYSRRNPKRFILTEGFETDAKSRRTAQLAREALADARQQAEPQPPAVMPEPVAPSATELEAENRRLRAEIEVLRRHRVHVSVNGFRFQLSGSWECMLSAESELKIWSD